MKMKVFISIVFLFILYGPYHSLFSSHGGYKRKAPEGFFSSRWPQRFKVRLTANQKLFKAIQEGQTERIKKLINSGACVNYQDMNFLFAEYCMHYVRDIIDRIKQRNAEKSMMKEIGHAHDSSLEVASEYYYMTLNDEALLEQNSSFGRSNVMKLTPLNFAARKGAHEIVSMLLNAGAELNGQDYMGATSLHHALDKGHCSVVKELIQAQADVNIQDIFGYTPLHIAVFHDRSNSIGLLLKAGAHVNFQGFVPRGEERGLPAPEEFAFLRTPLHLACMRGHIPIIQALLRAGARPEIQDENHSTAFHYAAQCNNEEVFGAIADYCAIEKNKVLREILGLLLYKDLVNIILTYYGYDTFLTMLALENSYSQTPLNVAEGFGYNNLVCYLKSFEYQSPPLKAPTWLSLMPSQTKGDKALEVIDLVQD